MLSRGRRLRERALSSFSYFSINAEMTSGDGRGTGTRVWLGANLDRQVGVAHGGGDSYLHM